MPLVTLRYSGPGWHGARWGEGLTEGSVRPWDLSYRFGIEPPPAPVPEPGTLFLIVAGAGYLFKRRSRPAAAAEDTFPAT